MMNAFELGGSPFRFVGPARHEVRRERVARIGCLVNEIRLDASTGLRADTEGKWMPVS